MSALPTVLQIAILIFAVLLIFNIAIFVHELGHFWAAKWRGLQIDRFQIWFGKPIWKKEINGVQYALGSIPAGGFVALPQMAPMDAIEGVEKREEPLPPISPLDKIIVAFAGPLFSLLLALASAVIVWQVGKPKDFIPTQIIGEVMEDSPAEKAGLKVGDKIIRIDGEVVHGFAGSLDSIVERIILSKDSKIEFMVQRPGLAEPINIVSHFEIPETKWWQRGGLRQVGIGPEYVHIGIGSVSKGSPAEKAGINPDDIVVTMDGKKFTDNDKAVEYIKSIGERPIAFEILRGKETLHLTATPRIPVSPEGKGPMLGVAFYSAPFTDVKIIHPGPFEQVGDSLRMMWTTITSLIAPKSSVGIGHLSGPVGIGSMMFKFLQMDNGWQRVLAFMVLLNVNLAVLNMLPFPVLDGGHITLAILEKIFRHPVKAKPLEILQTICAILLISLMLFVSSKDVGDLVGHGSSDKGGIVFPAD